MPFVLFKRAFQVLLNLKKEQNKSVFHKQNINLFISSIHKSYDHILKKNQIILKKNSSYIVNETAKIFTKLSSLYPIQLNKNGKKITINKPIAEVHSEQ